MRAIGWLLINTLQAVFTALWTAFWISAALVVLVITRNPDRPLIMARTRWAPGLLRFSGGRVEVEGGEGVDWQQPHIFLMNHQSAIDIPVAFMVLKTPLRFIAKKVLSKVPFLGWYMKATRMIFIERDNGAEAMASLQLAGERIREGASILAYPEGTRSRNSQILPLKKGVFMVALEAKVPVVPVAIHGADRVLSSTGFRVRPGTIRVKIGKPIPTAHLTPADRTALLKQVHGALIDLHLDIGGPGGDRSQPVARNRRIAPEAASKVSTGEHPDRKAG